MDLEMVLNELSLCTPAPDIITARQWMSQLILTLRQATTTGVKRILRTSNEINSLEIAPDYPIARWRNDQEVDIEERRFFRTLTNKAPFWNDVAEEFRDRFDLSQVWHEEIRDLRSNNVPIKFWATLFNVNCLSGILFLYKSQEAQGLGFALIIDGLAISFHSESKWHYSQLNLKVRRLDENDELIDESVEIVHASSKNHVKQHKSWIQTRIRSTINDGKELWSRKQELFPNLEFCDSVQKQLEDILSGQLELQPVVKTLLTLQNYCQTWNSGSFNIQPSVLECSPESQQTLNNSKYKQQREFICPDGQRRLFTLHAKLRICNWRIHFYPETPGKIIIGYIGRHLPTVKYK